MVKGCLVHKSLCLREGNPGMGMQGNQSNGVTAEVCLSLTHGCCDLCYEWRVSGPVSGGVLIHSSQRLAWGLGTCYFSALNGHFHLCKMLPAQQLHSHREQQFTGANDDKMQGSTEPGPQSCGSGSSSIGSV